jgi:hypothetical protein
MVVINERLKASKRQGRQNETKDNHDYFYCNGQLIFFLIHFFLLFLINLISRCVQEITKTVLKIDI